jgi:hypothetical protein
VSGDDKFNSTGANGANREDFFGKTLFPLFAPVDQKAVKQNKRREEI